MGKDSGVDTSALSGAMQAQTALAGQQAQLAQNMFNYGVGRTKQYADPLLNEFARIMGFGTAYDPNRGWYTPGGTQVQGGWMTGLPGGGGVGPVPVGTYGGQTIYEQNGQFFTGTPGGGGSPGGGNFFTTQSGQVVNMPGQSQLSNQPLISGLDIGTPTANIPTPGAFPQGTTAGTDLRPDSGGYFASSAGGVPTATMKTQPGQQFSDQFGLLNPTSAPGGGAGTGGLTPWTGNPADIQYNQGYGFSTTAPGQRYVSPVESSLFQLPKAQAADQMKQARQQILQNVPPGPQQNAMLANLNNQMNQSLSQSAFGQVQNMMNAMLGQSGAAMQGMQSASGALGAASQSMSAAGNMASTIAGLQMQAAQSNNSMLGGIFQTIGTIGGLAAAPFTGGLSMLGL